MFKILVFLVCIAVVASAGCPHALNKRQIRQSKNNNHQNHHNNQNMRDNNQNHEKDRRTRPVINPTKPPQTLLRSKNNLICRFNTSFDSLFHILIKMIAMVITNTEALMVHVIT